MAHHPNENHEQHPTVQITESSIPRPSDAVPAAGEDESLHDVDEPPDNKIHFGRRSVNPRGTSISGDDYVKQSHLNVDRRASLLTQGLLTSPDLRSASDMDNAPVSYARSNTSTYSTASNASVAELTSDGGNTSPARTNTPSPPLPPTSHAGLAILTPKALNDSTTDRHSPKAANPFSKVATASSELKSKTEEGTVRKRCIQFACARPDVTQTVMVQASTEPQKAVQAEPTKRSCTLRFACPAKPIQDIDSKAKRSIEKVQLSPSTVRSKPQQPTAPVDRVPPSVQSTIKDGTSAKGAVTVQAPRSPLSSLEARKTGGKKFKSIVFASSRDDEDAWVHHAPQARKKITVTDTLRKENAIRRIGEEAEEEAQNEEEEAEEAEFDEDADEVEEDDQISDDDSETSDGGNETDDEEGFAQSDDESEANPDYQFWTPGGTTAATSTDHVDYIRPNKAKRTSSESSIESTINTNALAMDIGEPTRRHRIDRRRRRSPKMRPGTPELPDSTDFVCGTLDEDRPLEAAYLSCLEQRKIAKHGLIPQDLDPSFPTSDPDNEDEVAVASDEHIWIHGHPDESDGGLSRGRKGGLRGKEPKQTAAAVVASPRRLHSPPATKRPVNHRSPPPPMSKKRVVHRSPPPRRLFGQSPRPLQFLPPQFRNLKSPPSSRRQSLSVSPRLEVAAIDVPHLAQRPNLTHTKSLPRTPNPFWHEHRNFRFETIVNAADNNTSGEASRANGDLHSRGPIDIVQGLETKRQRRKEKFWRQHCRTVGKEKERRCQPGKGAERMKELGLVMADRCRGYGQRTQLVLSV